MPVRRCPPKQVAILRTSIPSLYYSVNAINPSITLGCYRSLAFGRRDMKHKKSI